VFFDALAGQSTFTETYVGLDPGTLINSGDTLAGITYLFNNGANGRIDNVYTRIGDRSLGASKDDGHDNFGPNDNITVTLASPTTAFGVFFSIAPTATGSIYATNEWGDLADGGGIDAGTGAGLYDRSTLYFVGMISDVPFSVVSFGATGDAASTGFVVDNLTIVDGVTSAVPEPGSRALLATALALLLLTVRRRRA